MTPEFDNKSPLGLMEMKVYFRCNQPGCPDGLVYYGLEPRTLWNNFGLWCTNCGHSYDPYFPEVLEQLPAGEQSP